MEGDLRLNLSFCLGDYRLEKNFEVLGDLSMKQEEVITFIQVTKKCISHIFQHENG